MSTEARTIGKVCETKDASPVPSPERVNFSKFRSKVYIENTELVPDYAFSDESTMSPHARPGFTGQQSGKVIYLRQSGSPSGLIYKFNIGVSDGLPFYGGK